MPNENLKVTKDISCTIGVRMPIQERIELDAFCKEKDITLSKLIRVAVREFMKNHRDSIGIF